MFVTSLYHWVVVTAFPPVVNVMSIVFGCTGSLKVTVIGKIAAIAVETGTPAAPKLDSQQ